MGDLPSYHSLVSMKPLLYIKIETAPANRILQVIKNILVMSREKANTDISNFY